jgi:hypothetical protein
VSKPSVPSWKDGSFNEFGAYLPEADAELLDAEENLTADHQRQADSKCKSIAEAQGGFNSRTKPFGPKKFKCFYQVWSPKEEGNANP